MAPIGVLLSILGRSERRTSDSISGSLCLCTGYQRNVDAAKPAAERQWELMG